MKSKKLMKSKYWPHWRVSDRYKAGDTFGTASLNLATVSPLMALRAAIKQTQTGLRQTLFAGDTAMNLCVDNEFWMSDSKDEFIDHLDAIEQAKGRVLIHGLGLGCYLHCILSKKNVTHVDVVEKNKDVLGLIVPYFDISKRLTFHHDDAFTKKWKLGTKWDFVWHDIWPTICTDNLESITKLKRRFQNRCGKQAAWKEHDLRVLQRRNW